jgi:hypothetical protein
MKKKFLIYSDSWCDKKERVLEMHKLCHDLNTIGEEAYITHEITHPNFNCIHLHTLGYDFREGTLVNFHADENWIVVYPEYIKTNILEAKNAVRFLKSPFFLQYNRDLPIFTRSTYVRKQSNVINSNLLHIQYYDYDVFKTRDYTRNLEFFLPSKSNYSKNIYTKHPTHSQDITPYTRCWGVMSEALCRASVLYSYDQDTRLLNLAALCGCIPVVIPEDDNISESEWLSYTPYNTFGIAYTEKNIKSTQSRLCLVKEQLIDFEKTSVESVKKFTHECFNMFKK